MPRPLLHYDSDDFDNSIEEAEPLPPFRGPNWPVEKILARRNSHLIDKDGKKQLEYLVKWQNRDIMMSSWVAEEYLETKDVTRWRNETIAVSSSDEELSAAEDAEPVNQVASTDSDEEQPIVKIPRKSLVNSRDGSPVPTAQQVLNESLSQEESGEDGDDEDEETESLNGFVVSDDVIIYSDQEEDEEEYSSQSKSARDRTSGHGSVSEEFIRSTYSTTDRQTGNTIMVAGISLSITWLVVTILSTRAMESDHSNATSSPPFGAMHPEPFNPVATLPRPSSSPDPPIHKRVTRGRFERQSGLEGTEVSHGEADQANSFPSKEIVGQWTVTPRPKRSPQEHSFRVSTGNDSSSGQLHRNKREMVTKAQEKENMMEVSSVSSVGSQHGFVDVKTDPEDTSGHRGTKAVRRRRDVSSTRRRTTTEDPVASGQERAGEPGLSIPGTFIGT